VKLVRQITKEIISLDQMPMRYRLYDEEPWKSQGLRYFSVKNHLIFYCADETQNTVYTVRIIYGGRDISHQLNEIDPI
jgi:toxin ParE1/3/4